MLVVVVFLKSVTSFSHVFPHKYFMSPPHIAGWDVSKHGVDRGKTSKMNTFFIFTTEADLDSRNKYLNRKINIIYLLLA